MHQQHILSTLRGKTAAVLGIGISNLPLIHFLLDHGVTVTARDKKDRAALGETAKALEDRGVRLVLGADYLAGLDEELLFRSPGIRPDVPALVEAVARGARLISEMELFFELCPCPIIGITGSDGKTTTTTITYRLLEAARRGGRVYVGGNIGAPLLPEVESMTAEDIAVVELSSFQLQTMRRSPATAVITNITPNHLNWHTDMAEYTEAKQNILRYGCGRAVLNAENAGTRASADLCAGEHIFFSYDRPNDITPDAAYLYTADGAIVLEQNGERTPMLSLDDIRLPGRHNVENYMAAIGATLGLVDQAAIREIARTFGGVEHRLEFVRSLDGVDYYNGSIDSSPTRTAAALSALGENLIVICGGQDKHLSFAPLADALCAAGKVKAVVLTGEAGPQIRAAILACPLYREGAPALIDRPLFADAVAAAREAATAGDTVLLSPACTSFDAFANFEERGRTFKAIVNGFC